MGEKGAPEMFDIYQAVADLQSGWQLLHDVDRSERVVEILNHGTSGRTLAAALNCDEKQIRNLVNIAGATNRDKAQARAGEISSRELLRRANVRKQQQEAAAIKRAKADREDQARSSCESLLAWFAVEQLSAAHAEQIVDRTRQHLVACEMEGSLPKTGARAGMSVEEVIKRVRPAQRHDVSSVEYYAVWLARWLYLAFPSPHVCHKALDFAWAQLIRR